MKYIVDAPHGERKYQVSKPHILALELISLAASAHPPGPSIQKTLVTLHNTKHQGTKPPQSYHPQHITHHPLNPSQSLLIPLNPPNPS